MLPDIYITPLKPKINDCVKINNTAEAVGITWYSTQMTIREIKDYAREQLRYSLQNDNVYIDGYVYAAIFGFNQFNGRLDNSHNNIHVSKGEQFIYLMLRSREDQGVSLKLNLIKLDTAVPEREFQVPVDA